MNLSSSNHAYNTNNINQSCKNVYEAMSYLLCQNYNLVLLLKKLNNMNNNIKNNNDNSIISSCNKIFYYLHDKYHSPLIEFQLTPIPPTSTPETPLLTQPSQLQRPIILQINRQSSNFLVKNTNNSSNKFYLFELMLYECEYNNTIKNNPSTINIPTTNPLGNSGKYMISKHFFDNAFIKYDTNLPISSNIHDLYKEPDLCNVITITLSSNDAYHLNCNAYNPLYKNIYQLHNTNQMKTTTAFGQNLSSSSVVYVILKKRLCFSNNGSQTLNNTSTSNASVNMYQYYPLPQAIPFSVTDKSVHLYNSLKKLLREKNISTLKRIIDSYYVRRVLKEYLKHQKIMHTKYNTHKKYV